MKFDSVKDSGQRTQFGTGAVRDIQQGKGRFDLIPYRALNRLASHFENGSIKYGDSNWKRGIPLRTYLNSAARHLYKLLDGWNDEDHAAAVIWNLACFIHTKECIDEGILPKELDNMKESMEPPSDKPVR